MSSYIGLFQAQAQLPTSESRFSKQVSSTAIPSELFLIITLCTSLKTLTQKQGELLFQESRTLWQKKRLLSRKCVRDLPLL